MLLEFSCSNHRSIMDEVNFSMIASKDDTYSERLIHYEKVNVLRSSVIYGANGSGKSNFIGAIELMKDIVINSLSLQPGQQINQMPHKLLGIKVPNTYNIQFEKNGVRYAYGFSIKEQLVDEEYLYYFPNKRKKKIFERKGLEVSPGSQYKSSFTLAKEVLKDNRLFLSCLANFTSIKEVESAFLFFQNDLVIYSTGIDEPRMNNWYEYSIELMEKNPKVKERFISMLQLLKTDIVDVKTKISNVSKDDLLRKLPENFVDMIQAESSDWKNFEAKIVYNQFETDLMTEESTGIKKLFQIICPIIDIISNGKVLVCDEFESGLHEMIVGKIVEMFNELNSNRYAQLIFTTHDTGLLNTKLFRRDQIWFTELTKNTRSTDLYSLVELKNVRKNENLEKGYITGKYGAVPLLNQSLKSFIDELQTDSSEDR